MSIEQKLENCIKRLQGKRVLSLSMEEAANFLVSHYYNEIYCYLYKQTMDKELAMDLNQDIFIKMLASIGKYNKDKAKFRTWLYKIATNHLVDHYRSKTYRNVRLLEPLEDCLGSEEDFTLDVERRIDLEQVIQCIMRLDVTRQKIFRLKIFGEYSFVEIATMMNLPESNVKAKYYATQKHIREHIQRD